MCIAWEASPEPKVMKIFTLHLGYESLISVLNKQYREDGDQRTKATGRIGN
jgi:hypothetical protein